MKKKADKPIPDATVYLTKDGTRVRISKGKQFPVDPKEPNWLKVIKTRANEMKAVVRISDGHELWGYKVEDLKPI